MPRRTLLAVAVAASVGFVVLSLLVLHRSEPLRLDNTVDDFLFFKAHTQPRTWADRVGHLGSVPVVIAAAAALSAVAWWRWRSLALAAWCLATPAVAGVLVLVLKPVIGRTARTAFIRPEGSIRLLHPHYTFPSGHTVGAAAVAAVIVGLVCTAGATRRAVLAASIATGLVVIGVAWGRVAANQHTFTDVVGGVLLGTALGCVANAVRPATRRRDGSNGPLSYRQATTHT